MRTIIRTGTSALWLAAIACSGSIADQDSTDGDQGGARAGSGGRGGGSGGASTDGTGGVAPINSNGGTLLPEARSCEVAQVGLAPARRLTNDEYDRTVRDLLVGVDVGKPSLDHRFPSDFLHAHLFSNNADHQRIVSALADAYMNAAQALTAKVAPNLPAFVGCDPAGANGDACVRGFIGSFGKRAFRRPLTTSELGSFATFHASSRTATGNASEAVAGVIERFLISPQFLHRYESLDAPSGSSAARVNAWGLASRLSYLITGSMPDPALFAAAESGALAKDDELGKHVDRLLASPDARPTVRRFMTEWLELFRAQGNMRDAKLFPGYGESVAKSMREEAERTAEEQFFAMDGWRKLVSGNGTFLDATLAAYYGVQGGPSGAAFAPVSLDATRAAGVLTSGAIMTFTSRDTHPSVIYRGKWVRERLLCWDPPEVPLGVPQFPIDGAKTNRELTEMHAKDPGCAACHKLMDPIGFGFEHYDAAGRWRDRDNGQMIDDAGELAQAGSSSGKFTGAAQLGKRLADSEIARECMALRWFQNAVGRTPDPERDACSLRIVADALAKRGSLRDALVAFVGSSAFRYGRTE